MGLTRQSSAETVLERIEPAHWSETAGRCPAYGFRQSESYSDRLALLRKSTNERWAIRAAGRTLGAACVRVRTAPIPGVGLAFVSAGPLWSPETPEDAVAEAVGAMASALAEEYVKRRGVTLRIAPTVGDPEWNAAIESVMLSRGFQSAARAPRYRTILVDLRPEPSLIRANLAQKWRNQLNGAERQGIDVQFNSEADSLSRFVPLFDRMMQRKSFASDLGPDFYDEVQRHADARCRLTVVTAVHEGADVAGGVADIAGETATYILGATTEAGMKCKAAYALHWAVMMAAREAGCAWYDLGGIDPEGNPGVHHFKSGFGGTDVTAPGPFERRPDGWRGWIGDRVEGVYVQRRIRSLKQKGGQSS